MSRERIFLDTWFIRGLLNPRDQGHAAATALFPRVRAAEALVTTDAVLFEACNGPARSQRGRVVQFTRACLADPQFEVVRASAELFDAALQQFDEARDKEWGLTDCLSFVVMRGRQIQLVATGDHHFRQAGFIPLLS